MMAHSFFGIEFIIVPKIGHLEQRLYIFPVVDAIPNLFFFIFSWLLLLSSIKKLIKKQHVNVSAVNWFQNS